MIQCIRYSSWTGYMLMKFGMTCLRLALLKSPTMMKAVSGVFVNVAVEHIVKLGQSQASVLPVVECKQQ